MVAGFIWVYFILFYFVLLIIQSNYTIYVLSIYLEYYYSYLLTSALLENLAGSERKDVKESVRIEMKRRSEVRTKEEQRKIAIFWRRTKKFVRIYKEIGIEKNRYQAAARARTTYEFLIYLGVRHHRTRIDSSKDDV